ncbi:hypothetical protein M0R45_007077 [Rubus argutus]|uniref:Uncharacterized protein n=1 Tax=Rubus argutus TaxID=59490 RepID=A0AAW1YSJ7_RUBAR
MDGAIVGRFVLNDKTATIPFYSHSTYLGLCSELCSRFNQLQVGDFDMTYLVPNHPPCLLQSDLDVRVLYLSVVKDGKYFITISVTQSADHVICDSQFTSADENEYLGSYGTKYGEMCSNVAESFNAWIEGAAFFCPYTTVDGIRVKIMKMNARRRLEAESWNSYLRPVMDSILENLLEQGRH